VLIEVEIHAHEARAWCSGGLGGTDDLVGGVGRSAGGSVGVGMDGGGGGGSGIGRGILGIRNGLGRDEARHLASFRATSTNTMNRRSMTKHSCHALLVSTTGYLLQQS
jgi:hypothetical protein